MRDKDDAAGQILPLNRLNLAVGQSLGRRAEALWQDPNRAALLAQMPPLELYYLTKEVGLDEALPIVAATQPQIVQRFCDLDCWHEERFSATELDAYLAPFAGQSKQALAEAFLALDDEIQILFMQASLQVFDNREDEPPQVPDDQPTRISPDGFFILVNLAPEREVDPFVLIDALVAEGRDVAFKLLTAAKWELGAATEEEALQFREARLLDLGFADRQTALALLSAPPQGLLSLINLPVDAIEAELSDRGFRPAAPGEPVEAGLPAIYARALEAHDNAFVGALLALESPQLSQQLLQELVYLTNRFIVARGKGAHNLLFVASMAEAVRDTLTLGLDAIVPSEHPKAQSLYKTLLASWSLSDLFRLGIRQSEDLRRQAELYVKEAPFAAWLNKVDDGSSDEQVANQAFVAALLGRPPMHAGWDIYRPKAERAFTSQKQTAAAAEKLQALARQVSVTASR